MEDKIQEAINWCDEEIKKPYTRNDIMLFERVREKLLSLQSSASLQNKGAGDEDKSDELWNEVINNLGNEQVFEHKEFISSALKEQFSITRKIKQP